LAFILFTQEDNKALVAAQGDSGSNEFEIADEAVMGIVIRIKAENQDPALGVSVAVDVFGKAFHRKIRPSSRSRWM
jgi:hypothetical protein